MDYKQPKCAICGRSIIVSQADYCQVASVMGQPVEDIKATVPVICGRCTSSEGYKQKFFNAKKPHVALKTSN